jgi:hypothetical protein
LEREAWKTCVIRHPYGWIDTCLDFNEDVDPKLPILDGMALEWLNEQHMAVSAKHLNSSAAAVKGSL